MKRRKTRYAVCCLSVALALCVAQLGSVLLDGTHVQGSASSAANSAAMSETSSNPLSVQDEGVIRPESIDEGLSLNSLDDIRGRRVTVRQPVMEIVEDDIVREPAKEMSDVYQLWDYAENAPMHTLAQIDFASDKTLEPGNKDHPRYPMKGLPRSPKDSDGNVTTQPYFSVFKKYMLLHQAWDFNTHVNEIIQAGKLQKHPAADYIYGRVPDDAKAVKMHIVTDPIYRSPMTTGLYLVAGEEATVTVRGLKEGETLTLYTHHQDTMGYQGYNEEGKGFSNMDQYLKYWDEKIVAEAELAQSEGRDPDFGKFSYGIHGQWIWQNQKVPCMGTTFTIVGTGKDMEVKIGSMYGGPLYVKPTQSTVDFDISGAVLTPHFVLGVTTVEEFEAQLRKAPGLIATLDVENGQLIGPADSMRNADDIEKLAYFWHSVFAIDISLNGRDYNYNMTMCYDMHVPAGEAVALNSNFCAQPEYWFPICMNYETLTTKGNWGTFHELGHVQAKTHGVNWGFCDGDGEVWNNTLILLIYSMLCNMDTRVISVEHGEYVHPFTAIERTKTVQKTYTDKATGEVKPITDYGQINEGNGAHFDQLSMYATLLHSFGPDKFVDMFYTYKLDPKYCENKRADFVYRIGLVDRVNILDWVNTNYYANINDNMFTKSQLEFLKSLPDFVPVAYRWANGIDGHETARKHDVDGKHPTVFDLSEGNFSSPGRVEVLDVSSALHGTAVYDRATQTVKYTPPAEVTEYDQFDIIVRTESGRQVTLNVCLRLLYRGVYTQVWDLGPREEKRPGSTNPTVDQARTYISNKEPTSTETSSVTCKADFNHTNMEYFRSTFRFKATKDGQHTFYLRADDASEVRFYKNKTKAEGEPDGKMTTPSDRQSFVDNDPARKWTVDLKAGDTLFVTAELVNWGGKGHLHIGLRMPGEEEVALKDIKDIPVENIINPSVSDEELAKVDREFKGWQPRFVDSIKNATIDYQSENEGWQVLEAPVSEGGEAGQAINRANMVDGNESTIYHSKYNGGVVGTPHVFVIDTQKDQTFNYFDIIRRTNGNDKLTSYELYSCTAAEYANASHDGSTDVKGWTTLFKGTSSNVNAARQRINFSRTTVRYFKLIITGNSGHTVIKEVYAGITSDLSQTVKPSNYMEDTELKTDKAEGFVENSANGKLSTTKKGATFTFKFLGSGFELYADTAPEYGTASVTVDGKKQDEIIDLSDKPLFNKLVFLCEDLETETHTVIIETLEEKPFNISFINVKYGTPVAEDEYPAMNEDYGDTDLPRQFTREWRTLVKYYKSLESIKFLTAAPDGYKDTYVRIDTYIRLYRDGNGKGNKIAFVYPGTILSPIECGSLFAGLEKLTEIDFANFDTRNLRGVSGMFYGCTALTNIDVSSFKTENVLSYSKMFGGCTNLTSVNLKTFKLDENANIYSMFENCVALATIELPAEIDAAALRARARKARSEEEAVISCELPYVYQVENTDTYITELIINADMAGKKLILHNVHTFGQGDYHLEVPATCLLEGTVAYRECSTCHCDFDEATGTKLYRTADLVIPATGHDFVYQEPENLWDWPTCTKPGIECRHYCKNCNIDCPDDGGTVAMPASGHSYVLDTDEGNGLGYTIEYSRREETVETVMVDENGEGYYVQEETVVKGIAKVTFYLWCYTYSDWVNWTPCDHRTQVVLEFESDSHKEATCMEAETFFFDFSIDEEMVTRAMVEQDEEDDIEDGLSPSSFHVVTVNKVVEGAESVGGSEAKGHTFEDVAAIPATCTADGSTAGRRCTVCGHTEDFASTPALGHDMQYKPALEATCTTPGHSEGKVCVRCGEVGEGVESTPALGHDFSVKIEATDPTCTQVGHTEGLKCSRCEAVEGHDLVEDLGHEEEIIPGKAPTATESGLTEGKKCTRCGEILEAQEEIPALGVEEPTPGEGSTSGEGGEGSAPGEGGEGAVPGGETDPGNTTPGKSGPNMGVIIGIVAGIAVLLIGGIIVICCTTRKRRR